MTKLQMGRRRTKLPEIMGSLCPWQVHLLCTGQDRYCTNFLYRTVVKRVLYQLLVPDCCWAGTVPTSCAILLFSRYCTNLLYQRYCTNFLYQLVIEQVLYKLLVPVCHWTGTVPTSCTSLWLNRYCTNFLYQSVIKQVLYQLLVPVCDWTGTLPASCTSLW